jgi:hypothetical protein
VRVRRLYLRVALGGLVFLVLATVLVWIEGADDYGILLLTEYWIALCLVVGLVLLVGRMVRRLATRFKPG